MLSRRSGPRRRHHNAAQRGGVYRRHAFRGAFWQRAARSRGRPVFLFCHTVTSICRVVGPPPARFPPVAQNVADALFKTPGVDTLAVEGLRRSRVSSSLCLVDAADSDREGAGLARRGLAPGCREQRALVRRQLRDVVKGRIAQLTPRVERLVAIGKACGRARSAKRHLPGATPKYIRQ